VTRDEADTILYVVDQLRERGATAVDVAGVRAAFVQKPTEREPRREKTFHERLFRHLPKDPATPTRQERLKRKVEA